MSIRDENFDYLIGLEAHKEDLCPLCMPNICLCVNPSFQQYKNCLALLKRKTNAKGWLMHLVR
ncbi:MAG: hypothetical protein ACFFFH_01720 [Candidatus Thorarchaeota archaeon]